MQVKTIQIAFFWISAAILLALLFFIFKPYLGVIFLSGVLAVSFYPLYQKLLNRWQGKKIPAALVTTLVVVVCIIIPVVFLSALLLKEAVDLYNGIIIGGGSEGLITKANELIQQVGALLPQSFINRDIQIDEYARNLLNWIINHFDSVFAAVFDGLFKFVLMLLSIYYFLVSGEKIKNGLIAWSPLADKHDQDFLKTLRLSIDAVLRGRILVSAVQGFFLGIGFWFFGVGNPVLWGFVGGIASLIPMLGTSVVVVPAVAFLFLSGHVGAGVGLIFWGALAVGLIDNILSILFFKGKIKVHPLVILFAILGGVELFGMIGFLVGPVVVSAFLALMKVYPKIVFHQPQDY